MNIYIHVDIDNHYSYISISFSSTISVTV